MKKSSVCGKVACIYLQTILKFRFLVSILKRIKQESSRKTTKRPHALTSPQAEKKNKPAAKKQPSNTVIPQVSTG